MTRPSTAPGHSAPGGRPLQARASSASWRTRRKPAPLNASCISRSQSTVCSDPKSRRREGERAARPSLGSSAGAESDPEDEATPASQLQLHHYGSFLKGFAHGDPEQAPAAQALRRSASTPGLGAQASARLGEAGGFSPSPLDAPSPPVDAAAATWHASPSRQSSRGDAAEWESFSRRRPQSAQAFRGMLLDRRPQAWGSQSPNPLSPNKASLHELVGRQDRPSAAWFAGESPASSSGRRSSGQAKLKSPVGTPSPKDAETKRLKREQEQAQESLRILVQGRVAAAGLAEAYGSESGSGGPGRPSRAQEVAIADLWLRLDEDLAGEIDAQKFVAFFEHMDTDVLHAKRCMRWISARYMGRCSREALLQLMWPRLRKQELQAMETVMWLRKLEASRAPTPPLLSPSDRSDLLQIFLDLDDSRSGFISFKDLVKAALVDVQQVKCLKARYGFGDDGSVSRKDFIEMFCASHLRAHEDSKTAVGGDGQAVSFVRATCAAHPHLHFVGWMRDTKVREMMRTKPPGIRVSMPESCRSGGHGALRQLFASRPE